MRRATILPIIQKKQTMTMIKRYSILLILLWPFACSAQNNGQWLSLGLDGKLSKKTAFEFEQGFRFSDIFATTQSTYSDFGINYKLKKELKIGVNYRFTQRGGMVNATAFENRFSGEVIYKLKFDAFKFSSRLRYLNRYKNYFTSENGRVPQRFVRLKLDLDYELPDGFTLTAGTEIFWQLTAYYGRGFNNFWLYGGAALKLSDKDELTVLYIHQSREFASDDVAFGDVISIGFSHSFDFSSKE
jgi:hypothetical protein